MVITLKLAAGAGDQTVRQLAQQGSQVKSFCLVEVVIQKHYRSKKFEALIDASDTADGSITNKLAAEAGDQTTMR